MIAYIFYTRNTPADRDIERLQKELKRLDVKTKLLDADSVEGASLAELYDVLTRPAVVMVRDDGSIAQSWKSLPPADEISSLAHT